ncbi:hypothetical protein F4678DRAFT_456385 [Xylaria arbuscula]|nr:hypothetical protein F4678DRAFT_456385 [Xylaria arbuscula]
MANSLYVSDPAGDVELLVKERDYDGGVNRDGGRPIKRTAVIKVSSSRVRTYSNLLNPDAAHHIKREGGYLVIDGESIMAVRAWMDVFHGKSPRLEGVGISEIWWAIHFGNKYLLRRKEGAELNSEDDEDALKPGKDMSLLSGWFMRYHDAHKSYFKDTDAKGKPMAFSALAPAYWFDCPKAFIEVTRYIAYNTAVQIENINPTKYRDAYMRGVPNRVLAQLSAARASQRTRLEKWLPTVSAPCSGHKECLDVMDFSHKRSLLNTGIKSLFSLADRKRALDDLLDDLSDYEFTLAILGPGGDPDWSTKLCNNCVSCFRNTADDLTEGVCEASSRARRNFDGLCLDCMHKFKMGDDHSDYFAHDKPGNHDRNCRVRHKQPTWYFSYMGRKELMLKHQDRRAQEFRKRKGERDEELRRMGRALPEGGK